MTQGDVLGPGDAIRVRQGGFRRHLGLHARRQPYAVVGAGVQREVDPHALGLRLHLSFNGELAPLALSLIRRLVYVPPGVLRRADGQEYVRQGELGDRFAVLANLGVRTLYRRTDSAELLFIMLFCLALCLEVWRLGNLIFQSFGMPQYLNVLLTRVVLFSRFFGLLCLLVTSLYAVNMKYTQYAVLIGGMVVLAFTLAGVLPLDTSVYEPTFLYKLGDRQGYLFVRAILALLMLGMRPSQFRLRAT